MFHNPNANYVEYIGVLSFLKFVHVFVRLFTSVRNHLLEWSFFCTGVTNGAKKRVDLGRYCVIKYLLNLKKISEKPVFEKFSLFQRFLWCWNLTSHFNFSSSEFY